MINTFRIVVEVAKCVIQATKYTFIIDQTGLLCSAYLKNLVAVIVLEAANSSYETETEEPETPVSDLPLHLSYQSSVGVIRPWSIKEDCEDTNLSLRLQMNTDPLAASTSTTAMEELLTSSGVTESNKPVFQETDA